MLHTFRPARKSRQHLLDGRRRQGVVQQALGQPWDTIEGDCKPDQQHRQSQRGAHERQRYRKQERCRQHGAEHQQALLADAPPLLAEYVRALVAHAPGRGTARLKRLALLQRTYPAEPFLAAVAQALAYGLYDLSRLESLILKQVRGDFFQLPEVD